jgi:hypothetical protein
MIFCRRRGGAGNALFPEEMVIFFVKKKSKERIYVLFALILQRRLSIKPKGCRK